MVPGLQNTGSTVGVHGLSYSMACGIFLDMVSNPGCPAMAGRLFTTQSSGNPLDETLHLDFILPFVWAAGHVGC